jgi:hypothetical protein
MGRPISELRRSMTRREFLSWVAFARVYPVIEHDPPDFDANQPITPELIERVKLLRHKG